MGGSDRRGHGAAAADKNCPFSALPDECVLLVLRQLEVLQLLEAACVCRRWRACAADGALWAPARFVSTGRAELVLRHFRPREAEREEHTGFFARCVRRIDGAPLVCRRVALDYVDRGEGVCYRLLRSVSVLQQLRHPHVVHVALVHLDVGRNELRVFSDDHGVSLEAILEERDASDELRGGLPLAEAREVMRQTLLAVAHCHRVGVAHRNIKPKYILIARKGANGAPHVKLGDFNSVRWLGPQRAAGEAALHGADDVNGACSPTVVTQPYAARNSARNSAQFGARFGAQFGAQFGAIL